MRQSYTRSQIMKNNCRAMITAAVSKRGPVSRAQLVKLTRLSRSHVCGVVDELLNEGVLIETGSVSGGPGRPTTLVSIDTGKSVIGGVWLSEDLIHVSVAALDGRILAKQSIPYEACNESVPDVIRVIADGVDFCLGAAGKTRDALTGVGVTVSGMVDPMLGLVNLTFRQSWFAQVPVSRLLQETLGVPVYTDTDIRASALAHQWETDQAGNALYMSFCGGVGAALVIDHELLGANHGCAPIVAHMKVDSAGPLCACGRRGCLGTLSSRNALIRRIWPEIDPQQLSAQDSAARAARAIAMIRDGEGSAMAALEETVRYMGIGIANCIYMLDPARVYVGGTLVEGLPGFAIDLIRRETLRNMRGYASSAEIHALPALDEFEMQGALALVLLRPYRRLQEMGSSVFSLKVAAEAQPVGGGYTRS